MSEFFEKPILNSPYAYPDRHWELDKSEQHTEQLTYPTRRPAELTTTRILNHVSPLSF